MHCGIISLSKYESSCHSHKYKSSQVQDLHESLIAVFSHELVVRTTLSADDARARRLLCCIVEAYVEPTKASLQYIGQIVKEHIVSDDFSVDVNILTEPIERIEAYLRFLIHGLDLKIPNVKTGSADFTWISNYKGKFQFEKKLKEVVNTSPFWRATGDEIIRTSTTSSANMPKFERVLDAVQAGTSFKNNQTLRNLLQEVEELKGTMRSTEMKQLEKIIAPRLQKLAQTMVGLSSGKAAEKNVKTSEIQTVEKGLYLFKDFPGSVDLAVALKDWATKNAKAMAITDLLDFIETSEASEVAGDLAQLEEILGRCNKLPIPSDKKHKIDLLLLLLIRKIVTEARTSHETLI